MHIANYVVFGVMLLIMYNCMGRTMDNDKLKIENKQLRLELQECE